MPESSSLPVLLIRADAGGNLGTGHVMRMIALAQAWQDRGGEVVIASASCPEGILERLQGERICHRLLVPCEPGDESDLEQTIALVRDLGSGWVILDGYQFSVNYQRAIRNAGFKVLCVDDYGHCERWACDVLLNQNLGAEKIHQESEVDPFTQLLGARFALLRREFYERNWTATQASTVSLRKILVTLGGADPDNATGIVLALLEDTKSDTLEIRILAGAGNQHLKQLRSRESRHNIEILVNVSDMPAQYEWADGIISAGGSTCWEWLYLGLPACVVTIADNQIPVIEEISRKDLAISLGWFHELDSSKHALVLEQWIRGRDLAGNLTEADLPVDGWGARRVTAFLAGCPIIVREAGHDDLMTYFHWANEPEVRANSFHPEPILLDEHIQWFSNRVDSLEWKLLIGESLSGIPLGQVRLERLGEENWLLDYSVDSCYRSRGFGVFLLNEAIHLFGRYVQGSSFRVLAKVKSENMASIKTLKRAGFHSKGSSEREARIVELELCTNPSFIPIGQ